MKKILLIVFLFISIQVCAQEKINRSSEKNTMEDSRLLVKLNLGVPVYKDTTAANLYLGVDSCGTLIITRSDNKLWKRTCTSPKRWLDAGSGSINGTDGISINAGVAKIDTAFINARYARVFKTLKELRGISGPLLPGTSVNVSGYRVSNDGGGGKYIWDASDTTPDDGGGIIKVTSIATGRFIHEVNNGIIELKWWGARNSATEDIKPLVDTALKFMDRNSNWTTLHIAGDTTAPGYYTSSATWLIKRSVTITGDASMLHPTTTIQWPVRTLCIDIPAKGKNGVALNITVNDLFIRQVYALPNWGDTAAHGIKSRSIVSLNNLVISEVAGNGIQLEGCATPGSYVEGTVDFSEVNNCTVKFANTGLYIIGCDANKVNVYKFNATALRRWGIYDDGFLGNSYLSPHFAFCGSGLESNVVAVYNGKYYVAINNDSVINKNKRPDLFPAYWEPVSPMGKGTVWSSSERYWGGGPYNIQNVNSRTLILDPYFEGFQPPARQVFGTMSLNGTRGVEIKGGVDMIANGALTLNAGVYITGIDKLISINAPTTLVSLPAIGLRSLYGFTPTIFHEADYGYVYERYKNNNNDLGRISYRGTDFDFLPNNINSVTITPKTLQLNIPDTSVDASDYAVVWNRATKNLLVKPFEKIISNNARPDVSSSSTTYDDLVLLHRSLGSSIIALKPVKPSLYENTANLTLVNGNSYFMSIVFKVTGPVNGIMLAHANSPDFTNEVSKVGIYSLNTATGLLTKQAESINTPVLFANKQNVNSKTFFTKEYIVTAGVTYYLSFIYKASAQVRAPQIRSGGETFSDVQAIMDFNNSGKLIGMIPGLKDLPATQPMSGLSVITNMNWPWYAAIYEKK